MTTVTPEDLRALALLSRLAMRLGWGDSSAERRLAELVPLFGECADEIADLLDEVTGGE